MISLTASQIKLFSADIDGTYKLLQNRPLILVGLMGSGKSALGKRLSLALNLPFIDSDQLIEHTARLSITQIFAQEGEARFRALERQVIQAQLTQGPAVISTGGGAFCQPEIRAAIKKKGVSLWLDAPPSTLLLRIGNTHSRPLLHTGDPLEILTDLRRKRAAVYGQADLYLQTGQHLHKTSMKKLLGLLQEKEYIKRVSSNPAKQLN